jgi:hypothetical protein
VVQEIGRVHPAEVDGDVDRVALARPNAVAVERESLLVVLRDDSCLLIRVCSLLFMATPALVMREERSPGLASFDTHVACVGRLELFVA